MGAGPGWLPRPVLLVEPGGSRALTAPARVRLAGPQPQPSRADGAQALTEASETGVTKTCTAFLKNINEHL